MTDKNKTPHLRKLLAQAHKKLSALEEQKKEMHRDLVQQRNDMTAAIESLKGGKLREALEVLETSLAYRERNRPPRK